MFNRKNTPVTEVPRVTVQDGVIAEAWGLSLTEWAALTDAERRDLRNRVAYAPTAS
jgi:hypothetical protein